MPWGGNTKSFHFEILSTNKDHIERTVNVFRKGFKDILPPKELNIEEVNPGDKGAYYRLTFNLDYGLHEAFEKKLQAEFRQYLFTDQLVPFFNIFIEMVIRRNEYDSYIDSSSTDIFYLIDKAH